MHPDLTLLMAAERRADLDVRNASTAPEEDAARVAAQSRWDAELEQYGLGRAKSSTVLVPLRSSA